MSKIIAFIPHLFTLGNLFCGCLGIIFAFNMQFDWAAYMVFLAAFLDFFDGFFARILRVSGEFGKQLDSLADMVSFGVLPGVILYKFLTLIIWINGFIESEGIISFTTTEPLAFIALVIPIFSCYRLAKFNIDKRQTNGFLGLPTPANAILFCSIVLIAHLTIQFPLLYNGHAPNELWHIGEYISTAAKVKILNPDFSENNIVFGSFHLLNAKICNGIISLFLNQYFLIITSIVCSLLLVSEIPLFALKFKNFGWADNKLRYLFLLFSFVLLILFHLVAIPFIVILYIIMSLINNILKINV